MRRFLAATLLVSAILLAGATGLILQAVSARPALSHAQTPTRADLERGRRIYHQFNPAGMVGAQTRVVTLTVQDLDLGLNYLLGRTGKGHAHTSLGRDALALDLALRLPAPLQARYLNLRLRFTAAGDGLELSGVRLGRIPLPAGLVRALARRLLDASAFGAQLKVLESMMRGAALGSGRLHLTLAWDERIARAAMDTVSRQLSGVRPEQLDAYRQKLAMLASRRPHPGFAVVMGEMFGLARQRSEGGDPVTENRALLISLAEATNRLRLGLPPPRGGQIDSLLLAGRGDYVQHFTLSAALAAVAGEALADSVGLYKEVSDTRGGSGFSFSDLAADRAGARFGVRATASPEAARRVQAMLAGGADDTLYTPRIADLPEFLPEAVFLGQYGGVGGKGYARLLAEIERRIAALPVHAKH